MSLIIGIVVKYSYRSWEMIFASDGRSVKHGTTEIRSEEFQKVKKLSDHLCIGYGGHSGELFQDVYDALKPRCSQIKLAQAKVRLKKTIEKMLQEDHHRRVEDYYGPLHHSFMIGGRSRNELKFYTLDSETDFEPEEHRVQDQSGLIAVPFAPNKKTSKIVLNLLNQKLGERQSSDQIVHHIRNIILEASKIDQSINDHVFIRRITNQFELEEY